jgi:uncharacterized protein YciI
MFRIDKTPLCFVLCLLILLILRTGARAQTPDESKPPKFEMEQYQFGLLKRGPNWTATRTPETEEIQKGHMANISKMAELGKLMVAGPMGDNGDLRGIFIFKASKEEATALANQDPAIKSGRLVLELHPWMGPRGLGGKLGEEFRKDPKVKMTMTQFYLALLSKGPQADEIKGAAAQKLQLAHLWNIRRMMDAKTYLAAGPFTDNGPIAGLFVIAAKSVEEAKMFAEADPSVKAGRLSVALYPWWVAAEVWK